MFNDKSHYGLTRITLARACVIITGQYSRPTLSGRAGGGGMSGG